MHLVEVLWQAQIITIPFQTLLPAPIRQSPLLQEVRLVLQTEPVRPPSFMAHIEWRWIVVGMCMWQITIIIASVKSLAQVL